MRLPGEARFCLACGSPVRDAPPPFATAPSSDADPLDLAGAFRARIAHALAGRYVVRELLGAGGMGAVFLADDLALERPVAIKVLTPHVSRDAEAVVRFRREAKTAAKLDHPHIIPIHRVESEAGLDYFVMKYVAGRSLESILSPGARAPVALVQHVLQQAAAALGHAHRRGVVHRDVKPANIMLDVDDRVVLTDFGISKAGEQASRLTHTGVVIGTPHYMAPEQALGAVVDGRADQYALAVVGYRMLTGHVLFDGESDHAIVYRHVHEAIPRVSTLRADVPAHVDSAIARALSKAPSNRFPTMDDFAVALERGLSRAPRVGAATPRGESSAPVTAASPPPTVRHAVPLGAEPPSRGPVRQRLALWTMLIVLLAGGAATAAAWADRSEGAGGPPEPALSEAAAAPGRRAVAMLSVASSPRAAVFLDGVALGTSPVTNHPLVVGRSYRLRLERPGFQSRRETITVSSPTSIRRRFALVPKP